MGDPRSGADTATLTKASLPSLFSSDFTVYSPHLFDFFGFNQASNSKQAALRLPPERRRRPISMLMKTLC